jgi:O-antigen/teichoic acid export membrane protein
LAGIGREEVQAIALLALAMLFANWADALSSLFYAFEKMEYPAGLTNAVALLKVTLGALVLLAGWGYVGLAGVSLLMNILQVGWLYALLRTTLFRPDWRPDAALQRWMLGVSGPLMLNHLLATIFWRIDVWLLRPLAGAAAVGLYSVGLKYLDGLNIVPSVFTMAVFPLMSRYARASSDSLLRAYVLSLRLLVMISLPVAMTITVLAEPLVWLVGGAQYLDVPLTLHLFGQQITVAGGSDLALRVIIWSIPIGFVNSVTQYVLIAVDQQRFLTRAFVLGVVFNIVGNLLAIPRLGYVGAALVTILSEFSLLFPFYASVRAHVGSVPWPDVFGRPLLALAAMGLAVWGAEALGLAVWWGAALGGVVYLAALAALGVFHREELVVLRRALRRGEEVGASK